MKSCPYCKKEIPDFDWNCPFCHKHVGSEIQGTGHATKGNFEDVQIKHPLVSNEDKSMIKESYSSTIEDDDHDY